MRLKSHNTRLAIRPLFDIGGAKIIADSSKVPSPLACVNQNNYIQPSYACNATQSLYNFSQTFDENYKQSDTRINLRRNIFLNEQKIIAFNGGHGGSCDEIDVYSYHYKTIPSRMAHVSPSFEEIDGQIQNMVAPNLPIDAVRYVDFISARGGYRKIEYPALFDI